MTKVTEVAAAVIVRGEDTFLLAQRPAGKPYPGYWEFPGGKIEPGEDARAALVRELKEELDIEITACTPWITRMHVYTHATVRLHFFRVTAWRGEPRPLEDQAITWQSVGATTVSPMLPANGPLLAALTLPPVMVVTSAEEDGIEAWVRALGPLLSRGRVLVQVREKSFGAQRIQHLLSRILARTAGTASRVVVNSDCGAYPQASGVHLTARALMAASERPAGDLVGASCHDAGEVAKAIALGVDYLVVGPVQATASHPLARPLGWEGFAALVRGTPIPAYAIGGLRHDDLAVAREHGAHGVALRGGAFGV